MINQKIHYLDNSATTKPCDEAVKAAVKCMTDTYGNPSSLHSMGTAAMKILENSRNIIANALKCSSDCITFTSGATESSNMAIKGAVRKYGRKRKKIITTSVEHSSVKEIFRYLETQGYDAVYISPDSNGKINPKQIFDEVDDNTCLVSMMLVNNETGYILPVEKTFTAIKKRFPHIITHCDCVQAFMKIPVDTRKLNADFISLSGHKVHAPKGTGILYTAKGIHIPPLVHGGGQEKNIRPGTEGLPLIAGFAAAVEKYSADISERYAYVTDLKNYLLEKISVIDGIAVNSHDDALPYIVNISAEGIRSEIMLHFLEEHGIFISSGSACSKGAKSGVLSEFGINDRLADSALRISFCSDNDKSDIDAFIDGITEGKNRIMR